MRLKNTERKKVLHRKCGMKVMEEEEDEKKGMVEVVTKSKEET